MPVSDDSFDVAISTHIYKHQSKVDPQMALPRQASSIWKIHVHLSKMLLSVMKHIIHPAILMYRIPRGNMESFTGEPAHDDPVDEC